MAAISNKRTDSEKRATTSRPEIPLTEDLIARHKESRQKYPRIHLSKGEFIIMEVRRHPIGLISMWVWSILLTIAALAILPFYAANRGAVADMFAINASSLPTPESLAMPVFGLALLFIAGGALATYVYSGNLFYLTNESIIQYLQASIFSTKEQQINLVNVDDVSYRREGIFQQVFNYGTVRISTEGDERNPYVFYFVASPHEVTRAINEAMEEATGFAVRYRQHKNNLDSSLPPPEHF